MSFIGNTIDKVTVTALAIGDRDDHQVIRGLKDFRSLDQIVCVLQLDGNRSDYGYLDTYYCIDKKRKRGAPTLLLSTVPIENNIYKWPQCYQQEVSI